MIGKSVRRKEDERLLTGRGQFVDDLRLPGTVHLAVVRSLYAHARIMGTDPARALAVPGVRRVVDASDYPEFSVPLPRMMPSGLLDNPYCDLDLVPPHYPLARGTVHYQGQPIAVVLADSPYAAADGAEAVTVDYEPLPVVASVEEALGRPDGHRVHEGFPNLIAHLAARVGDVETAFRAAEIVFEERVRLQRVASVPIEGRGVVAAWDPASAGLTIWSTNQGPYHLRDTVALTLGLPPDHVRVISRDIGGAFGGKGLSPEDIVAAVLAYHLRRPIKWTETRVEYFFGAHARDQVHDVRVAASRDGAVLGMEIHIYKDVGAYNYYGPLVPSNTLSHLPTHYKIPSLRAEAWCVLTHKVPSRPTRGAGRPEATFVMDRVLDRLAREAELDPLDVRLRNIIRPEEMPYRTGLVYRDGVPIAYDGGDYPLTLRKAVELADYHGWRRRQRDIRGEGRLVGVAISSYLEAGGIGPCEGARVRADDVGRVTVFIGVNSHGQSHATTLAQVCASHLGARLEDVAVLGGDTSLLPMGFGTGASRIAVNTGNAVALAAGALGRKMRRLAADLLECGECDIRIVESRAHVAGAPHRGLAFAELAQAAARSKVMADLGGPELSATEFFYPESVTWSSGVHVAVVEVHAATGKVEILRYVVVHDCGVLLNPLVVEGQIDGGVAQGIGAALGEELVYDGQGQLLTGNLMEYPLPRAEDVPRFEVEHVVFPTDKNPLGVRAVGESGPISAPAVLAGAVEDALEGRIRVTRMPLTAPRVYALVEEWRERSRRAERSG